MKTIIMKRTTPINKIKHKRTIAEVRLEIHLTDKELICLDQQMNELLQQLSQESTEEKHEQFVQLRTKFNKTHSRLIALNQELSGIKLMDYQNNY